MRYQKKPVIVEAMRYWGDVETFEAAEEFMGRLSALGVELSGLAD